MKPLILCADDFAVHEHASRGIASLAAQGRISAASAMVLAPRWPADAALLRELRGRVDVGLHLDWTSDFARAAGHGLSLGAAMRRSALGGFDRRQAAAVIAQQLDRFEQAWQAAPDYVDGHQHVQQFAGIREALVEALARRYGAQAVAPYLRVSRAPAGTAGIKGRVIAGMGADALQALAARAGLPVTTALLGIYDFSGEQARYAALMARWLAQAPAGAIIMCHPAQAQQPDDPIGAARAREFAYLSGPDFAAALAHAGVRLAQGAALARH